MVGVAEDPVLRTPPVGLSLFACGCHQTPDHPLLRGQLLEERQRAWHLVMRALRRWVVWYEKVPAAAHSILRA